MLKESSQTSTMSDKSKLKLQIHHSNLFRPNPVGAKLLAWGIDSNLMVVVKTPKADGEKIQANIIEIYDTTSSIAPRLLGSIITHENITGIAWVGFDCILTTSHEQTITIYSVKEMRKIYSTITDYGPILSMAYYKYQSLLITATEYGYVAAYTVAYNSKSVKPLSKMVKVNGKIVSVSASINQREVAPAPPAIEEETPTKKTKKRKRLVTEGGDEMAEKDAKSLDQLDVTLFGATGGNVVAWNFHKTTIIETVHVCDEPHTVNRVLALARGDVLAIDSTGVMSTIDCNSYTCLRSVKVSNSSITTIGCSPKEDRILLSGIDPTIHIFKRGELDKRNYKFFEKTRVHTQQVTSILFVNRNEFFSCAINGIIVRCKMDAESRRLDKYPFIPSHFSQRVKFSHQEQLAQNDSSIVIWKLPQVEESVTQNGDEKMDVEDDKLSPLKLILLRSKRYIYSTTFSTRWIVYATSDNCSIIDRLNCNEVRQASKKLPNCTLLELCDNDKYLVTVAGKVLNIIDLEKTIEEKDKKGELVLKFKIVAEHFLKTAAIQLLYLKHLNLLAVLCGQPKFAIYFYRVEQGADKNLLRTNVIMFESCRISFVTFNKFLPADRTIYAYTCENKIIKLDCHSSSTTSIENRADEIIGLPVDVCIAGMLVLPDDQCILYDTNRFFRVDMKANRVMSTNSDYSYIIKMDFMFDEPSRVALAEVLPEDYESSFPKLAVRESHSMRFGTR